MNIILSILIGYLIGSIPFALIFGKKIGGIDVRKYGSGNLGGTNVIRLLGVKVGIPVIICDIGKGFLAAFLGVLIGGQLLGLIAGIFAVLGHLYPIFAGFKGGKGAATGAGVFFFLAPMQMSIAASVFVLVLVIFGYVSLASILGSVTGIILFILPEFITGMNIYFGVRLGGILIGAFVIYKHRSNIKKLAIGEEKRTLYKKRDNK
ncbi:MAG: glycerol-3-phosphate 1-O-acyltransferase PlsY [Firmicutes bacterium]|nr:glycerol-3-phosphate 1-O-acyltransferase PlsY [Bacillota bacterium]